MTNTARFAATLKFPAAEFDYSRFLKFIDFHRAKFIDFNREGRINRAFIKTDVVFSSKEAVDAFLRDFFDDDGRDISGYYA